MRLLKVRNILYKNYARILCICHIILCYRSLKFEPLLRSEQKCNAPVKTSADPRYSIFLPKRLVKAKLVMSSFFIAFAKENDWNYKKPRRINISGSIGTTKGSVLVTEMRLTMTCVTFSFLYLLLSLLLVFHLNLLKLFLGNRLNISKRRDGGNSKLAFRIILVGILSPSSTLVCRSLSSPFGYFLSLTCRRDILSDTTETLAQLTSQVRVYFVTSTQMDGELDDLT